MAACGVFLHVLGGIVVERTAGLGIKPGGPVQLVDILLAGHERAVHAVEHVVEPIAACVHDQLAILAIDLGVDDRMLGDLVVVIGIVGRVLEAPLDLAVRRREGEHARGPLVVARPVFRVPVRAGIADALVERVGVRIIRGGLPDRRAAVLPALLAVLPGFVARLAGTRNGVGAPDALAGVEVGAVDEAADAELAPGGADDSNVAHDQRCRGQRLGDRRIGDLALPGDLAGRLVDGDQPAVERDRDHLVLPQCDAAVVDAATGDITGPGLVGLGVHAPLEGALLAACHVDGVDRAPAVGHVHDAVLDDRRAFQVAVLVASAGAFDATESDAERDLEILDVAGVDGLELREPIALVVAVMEQPIMRLLGGVERALMRHVGCVHRSERARHQQQRSD